MSLRFAKKAELMLSSHHTQQSVTIKEWDEPSGGVGYVCDPDGGMVSRRMLTSKLSEMSSFL